MNIPYVISKPSIYYPKAERIKNFLLFSKGNYDNNYPIGAIIHYTAGRFEKGKQSAMDTLVWAKNQGYNFLMIAYDGTVIQTNPLNEWGEHAGKSCWAGLDSCLSNKFVGIEICNAGHLTKIDGQYFSWYNTIIPAHQVRVVVVANDNQVKGYYHKYSEAQEKSLIELLIWLKKNNPTIFETNYILGHDEVSSSGKQDPGGALSMTMTKLRALIRSKT